MQDVFISYSRRNVDFARNLEKRLEEFKPPRELNLPQRYLNVFRDEADIMGSDYFQSIERHLGDSGKLIVVCTPEARASTYVNDEIRRFAQARGAENIVPILLSGIPNNEAAPGREAELAFPDGLCEAVKMPLAISYVGFNPKKDRLDKAPFADSWFTLLANIYGVSRADIELREKRRQARNRRITVGIVSGVITSLVLALVVSLIFWKHAVSDRAAAEVARDGQAFARKQEEAAKNKEAAARRYAEEQRTIADERRLEAERERAAAIREAIAARSEMAGRVAVQALEKLDGAPDKAVQLGLAAVDTFHSHNDPIVISAVGALQKINLAFAASRPLMPPSATPRHVVVDSWLQWAAVPQPHGGILFGRSGSTDPRPLAMPRNALKNGERWATQEPDVVITGDRVIAAISVAKGKVEADRHLIIAWPLSPQGAGQPSVIAVVPKDLGPVYLKASPDGKWLFWTDRYQHGYLRRVDVSGAPVEVRCGMGYCEHSAFSPDSRMFLVHAADIRRFVLTDTATEQPAVETKIWDVAAFDAVVRSDAREPDKTSIRLAILGRDAAVEWFDISEPAPERHELPRIFTAFEKDLDVQGVSGEHVRTSLEWRERGEGVLVTVQAKEDNEFGIAAFHNLKSDGAWQPLEHRYELKAFSRTARSSSEGMGYSVKNSANLGVSSALWVTPFLIGTVGFDGTLLARQVDEEQGTVSDKFKVLATNVACASFAGKWILTGKRDGRIELLDLDDEGQVVQTLNGHGAPLREVRAVSDYQLGIRRILSTDTSDVARLWDMSSPIARSPLNSNLYSSDSFVTADWKWLVHRDGREFWPLRSANPLWQPVRPAAFESAKGMTFNADRSRAATLHTEGGAIVVRLWNLIGDQPPRKPIAERRFPIPNLGDSSSWKLRLSTVDGQARLLIGRDDYQHEAIWITDFSNAPLRPIGNHKVADSSGDLQWLVIEKTAANYSRSYELVPLSSWPPKFIPITGAKITSVSEWSRDGRWLAFNGSQEQYVLDLQATAVSGRANRLVTWSSSYPRVLFPYKRPPMVVKDGTVYALQLSRFVKITKKSVDKLAWDDSGEWLALSDKGRADEGRAFLTRVPPDANAAVIGQHIETALRTPPLPPAAVPEARGAFQTLHPFPSLGWIIAEVEEDHILLWHRRPDGTWEPPLTFTNKDLRIDYLSTVQFRPDGRMALLEDQILSFEPEHLMNYSRKLVGAK